MLSHKKTKAFIKPNLCQHYIFSDQGWNTIGDPRWSEKFQYLASVVCAVGDRYYVKHKTQGTWEELSNKAHTVARVYQEHGGRIVHNGVTHIVEFGDIGAFMATGIVHFRGTTYAPLMGDFLWFNGERRLNVYVDRRIDGDNDHIGAAEEFLKVIRNSLCAAPDEVGIEAMIEEIYGTERTPFRWVMHWLAARYQRPGYITQTNLWFCGARGTGKGSLLSIMRSILGAKAIGKIDAADIARGWSGSMFGCDILEWDEFKGGGWHDFNRFIKEKTGNETYAITQRNVGDILHPNVAFHVFSTNERFPIYVEKDDRQNSFISTSSDEAWKARAKALWTEDTNEIADPAVITGFAALLNEIKIDLAFIRTPLVTAKKTALIDYFDEDTIKEWLSDVSENSIGYEMPSWEQLHTNYAMYVRSHLSVKPMDIKEFRTTMKDGGHAKETVGKTNGPDGKRKSFRYVRLTVLDAVSDDGANIVSLPPWGRAVSGEARQ